MIINPAKSFLFSFCFFSSNNERNYFTLCNILSMNYFYTLIVIPGKYLKNYFEQEHEF